MDTDAPRHLHMMPRDALRFIINDAIDHGDDQDYIDEILETGGYEFTSRKQGIWGNYRSLVIDAANLSVFPRGGPDEAEFLRVYEVEGRRAAAVWFRGRFKVKLVERVTKRGNYSHYLHRVAYFPVGSKLAEQRSERQPPGLRKHHKKDGKVKLL
jgi:hypothetical protein